MHFGVEFARLLFKTYTQLGIEDRYEAIAHNMILEKIKIKSINLAFTPTSFLYLSIDDIIDQFKK